jgi:hypothetical protein
MQGYQGVLEVLSVSALSKLKSLVAIAAKNSHKISLANIPATYGLGKTIRLVVVPVTWKTVPPKKSQFLLAGGD